MQKEDVHFTKYLAQTINVLSHEGALLVSADKSGRANVMTIGWGTFGWIWSKPILVVLVRPSRYTFEYMEQHGEFTVNIPSPALAETVAYCGRVSGRNFDKFAERGLTAARGRRVSVPVIKECAVHYECREVHKNDVLPDLLAPEIDENAYGNGDYHRIYYGEILATYADPDAAAQLSNAARW